MQTTCVISNSFFGIQGRWEHLCCQILFGPVYTRARDLDGKHEKILTKSKQYLSKNLKNASIFKRSSIAKQLNISKILNFIKTTNE